MDINTMNDVLDSVKEDIFEVYEIDSDFLRGALTALYKVRCALEYRVNVENKFKELV